MYLSVNNYGVITYRLTVPYEISSATRIDTFNHEQFDNFVAIEFDSTGTKLFIEDGDEIILDAEKGEISINVSENILKKRKN